MKRCDLCGNKTREIAPVFLRMVPDPLPDAPENRTAECAFVCPRCIGVVQDRAKNAPPALPPLLTHHHREEMWR